MGGPEIFGGGFYGVIRRAIVIGNGFAGSENQSIGLVRALGLSNHQSLFRVTRPRGGIHERLHWLPVSLHKKLDYVMKQFQTVRGKKLIPLSAEKCLSDILEADAKHISKMARETFEMDGPLLVVASGRDTISVASYIKQLAPENVFVVQIQHPRSGLNRFDLVITPRHDYYPLTPHAQKQIPWFLRRWITPREPPDRHVVLTVGALHQADSAALRSAASAWHDKLASLPRPLLVVNIGGPASSCRYGADLAKQLTVLLQNVLWSCGSLRISFSRRTPEKVSKILVRELGNHPKVYIWNGEEPNPHMGHLSWADAFVITADSVSMLSEACSTGKPVYVIGAEHCKWKFADFHKSLLERGVVRPFTGKENISESWSYSPLNGTAEAASRVHVALAERGWKVQS
ncbi:mitochondrial fission protein ELM1 isoform X2 [Vitis vinifera]|uniref:mitochondrial fission protein ELM1 isoform X2 n=1 Tax=Vitis vinifera TaxID=29760 RepID=UPI00053FC1C8|nr:mitochondrial fission protein ELM1 isoform X2 [Vitis vinifera]|eukprot:XP_010654120.1 PREDICTED: mitochondrial fission protein ELM1 isoform X2 [Vitis vinifera]